jgi:phosphoribosylaminoimidazole-succinocarboxamide synthase
MQPVITRTNCPDLKLHSRGKVRDIYELDDALLIVATDRISAFDVIMDEGIPGKGVVLTQISKFWFERMRSLIPHHIITTNVNEFPAPANRYREQLDGRSMLVRKTRPLPVECIVRGYLAGSGWKEYRSDQTICGVPLPPGLTESQELPAPIFTPSTKAEIGAHDENIPFTRVVELCGEDLALQLREISLAIYRRAAEFAAEKGIIIADTKFEFGVDNGTLVWIDEALTPDSSRFWPRAGYTPGRNQPSFDKQFLRDYLETLDWNKSAPPPPLPEDIVRKTSEKYREALRRITGIEI